jgi:Tfp pilus assembly protein PilF
VLLCKKAKATQFFLWDIAGSINGVTIYTVFAFSFLLSTFTKKRMSRIKQLEEFLKEQPNDSFLKHALALEYIKLNELASAEKLFKEILHYDENYYGSYYHLAKLYERTNQTALAISTYEKGIAICKNLKENHALGELKSAYEELVF